MIDPLSGLDPAAKELAETRLMAERALFLSRHLPELIRWETEYLAMNTLEVPEVARLLSDTTKLSESADRFSQVAQTLPQLVSSEREQLVMTLKSERQGLTALAAESKQALTAGKQMADSANATLKSFQAVMAQLEAKPSDPNAEPFRISDYTAAAAQISQTSERLAELLDLFNRTIGPDNVDALSTRVDGLSRQVESRSRDVVDYAYRKALIGSALICAMGLGTALAYQLLSAWLQRINASRMPLRRREPAD
jgi:DNA repair ATPase RecN